MKKPYRIFVKLKLDISFANLQIKYKKLTIVPKAINFHDVKDIPLMQASGLVSNHVKTPKPYLILSSHSITSKPLPTKL